MNNNQYNYNQEYRHEEKRGGKILGFIIAIIIIIIIIFLLLRYCGVGILTGINIENPGIIYVDENKHIDVSALGTGDRSNTRFNFSIVNHNIASLRDDYQIGNEVEAVVKGLAPGDTTISVTAELGNTHKSEQANIVVCDKLEVSDILDKTITVTIGKIKYIKLDLGPNERCYANLKFNFGDNSIAKRVGDNGIEGLGVGKTTLTINDDLGNSVEYDLVVVNPNSKILATGIKLNTNSLSVCVGGNKTLKATISPKNVSDKSVSWSSNNEEVALVKNGRVYGKKIGTAKVVIITQDGSNKMATASIKVVKCSATTTKVTGIKFNKTSESMYVGETKTLTAIISPSNASNKTITCTSSNNSIATVTTSGDSCVVKGVTPGNVTITATTKDGNKKATANIVVSKKPSTTISVTGISFDKTSETIYIGDSKTLTATITPSNASNKEITCTSSNSSIATVSTSGNACVVKGVKEGTVTVTATTKDGNKKATMSIAVKKKTTTVIKVTSITLNPTSKAVNVGDTAVINVGILPTNATNQTVTCSSLNTSIFTVTTSGKSCIIKGVKAGSATLSVIANDGSGVKATASITVKNSGSNSGQCYCCGNSQGCNYKWSSDGSSPGNNCAKVSKTQTQCVGNTLAECNITGCVKCDSSNKCTQCSDLYKLSNGKCTYVGCATGCNCDSYGNCTTCKAGYHKVSDGSTYGKCEPDSPSTGSCTIANCSSYKSTSPCQCKSCNSGYTLMTGAEKCCKNITGCSALNMDCTCRTCSSGFVSDGKGGCTCNVAHCTVYRSQTSCECQTCLSGYFLVGGGKKCCPIRANCETINTDTCKCTQCASGYESDGNGGCKAKPVSSGTCVCNKGTYGGTCTKIYGSGYTLITSCLNGCYGSNVCLQHSDNKYYCTERKQISGSKDSPCQLAAGSGYTGTLSPETTTVTCGTYSNCASACSAKGYTSKSGSCTK